MISISTFTYATNEMSRMDFTNNYVQRVKTDHKDFTSKITKPLEVVFKASDGEERISYLDNAYSEYLNSPEDLNEILKRYTGSFNNLLLAGELNYKKEQIFPVIKDHHYIKQVSEIMKKRKGKGFPFYYEKLNDALYILYAFDTENSIQFVNESDIKELGIKKEELLDIAKENLRKSIPNVSIKGENSTLSMIVADGNYEASFLLFDSLWTNEYFPVKGDIVVYVPSRDFVLVTGSNDSKNLAKAHSIVFEENQKWSHVVADVGFIRKNNKWEIYQP